MFNLNIMFAINLCFYLINVEYLVCYYRNMLVIKCLMSGILWELMG